MRRGVSLSSVCSVVKSPTQTGELETVQRMDWWHDNHCQDSEGEAAILLVFNPGAVIGRKEWR